MAKAMWGPLPGCSPYRDGHVAVGRSADRHDPFAPATSARGRRRRRSGCLWAVTLVPALFLAGGSGPSRANASGAQLHYPITVAVGSEGTVYIADTVNRRIRAVGPDGRIRTVAGNGQSAPSPDGIPATAASLSFVRGLGIDADGLLYFTEVGTHRVRRIEPDGLLTTVAGTGTSGFSGDGGPATQAHLDEPSDLAFDAEGNLYIADTYNRRIRMIDVAGTITTVAGREVPLTATTWLEDLTRPDIGDGGPATEAILAYPFGVGVAQDGSLYIADSGHNRVRRVDPAGRIHTIAGIGMPTSGYVPVPLGDGGPATGAVLNFPVDVIFDMAGNAYITDRFNHRIRRVDAATGIITTVAGLGVPVSFGDGGPATLAGLDGPVGIALDASGRLYIADYRAHRIRLVGRNGVITTFAGTGEPGYSGDEG